MVYYLSGQLVYYQINTEEEKLISITAFLTAITSILFILFSGINEYLYILGFLLGLTIFSIYPLSIARANDVVDENKDVIEISRTLLFTYGIGSFISPLFIGFGISYFNPNFLFLSFAILGLFLSIYALTKDKVAAEDMSVFVNIPVTSGPELAEMDPRQDENFEN